MKRWRGLKDLLSDAVDGGARAVEEVHRETAAKPFDALERVPALARPVAAIRAVHDTVVAAVYGSIRLVNRMVAGALDVTIDTAERSRRERAGPTTSNEPGPEKAAEPVSPAPRPGADGND